jgi:hypothetical protein
MRFMIGLGEDDDTIREMTPQMQAGDSGRNFKQKIHLTFHFGSHKHGEWQAASLVYAPFWFSGNVYEPGPCTPRDFFIHPAINLLNRCP